MYIKVVGPEGDHELNKALKIAGEVPGYGPGCEKGKRAPNDMAARSALENEDTASHPMALGSLVQKLLSNV